jgi:nucleoside transporter
LFWKGIAIFRAVFSALRKSEYAELMILFFIQATAMAIWFVPLGAILDANHLPGITPYAFATVALASFISPLMFGAMADRHVEPAKVLRGLATSTSIMMALIGLAIQHGVNGWLVLLLILLFSLTYAPMFSISTALALARLENARKEFGAVRSLATIGWMAGALLVGLMNLDRSAKTEYLGAVVWLLAAGFTFFLPRLEIPSSAEHLSWKQRMGLDALTLLRDHDTRVVFITTTLFNIPISAFYPYAPTHLHDLGMQNPSAWMGLAQVTEIIAMFSLGWLLLKWRLKWIIVFGLGFGVARFALSALNTKTGLLLGIGLHGASYVLVYISAMIYINQRVEPAWRTRAQALLTLMNGGVGNLIGYLFCGWWFADCTTVAGTNWTLYWALLSLMVVAIGFYFTTTYRGKSGGEI